MLATCCELRLCLLIDWARPGVDVHAETIEEEMYLGEHAFFAAHHRASSDTYLVIAPPLFEELSRTRKILVNLSRLVAETGINVVRFDYYGTGLSDGDFMDFDLHEAQQNLATVLAYCRDQGARRIVLLGFRFGGYLALAHQSQVDAVLAWEPVLDLAAHFREMTRIELGNELVAYGKPRNNQDGLIARLEEEGSVLLDGFRVGRAVYRQFGEAPAIPMESLRSPRVSLFFWEHQKLHEQAQKLGVESLWITAVRFSWRHIRFLEPRSQDLFVRTMARLPERRMHASEQREALSL